MIKGPPVQHSHALLVVLALALGAACGGRSVNVDRANPSDGTGGTTSVDRSPNTILTERINQFWVDDTRLYWQTQEGSLQSCLQSDCSHSTISYGTTAGTFAVGRNDVYWVPRGLSQLLIYTCPKAGCSGNPTTVLHDPNGVPQTLSADGDYFYWSSAFDIYRCPVSGCGPTPEVVASGHTIGAPLTFEGDNAYWPIPETLAEAETGAAGAAGNSGEPDGVLYAPKNGSAPVKVLRFPADKESATGANGGFSSYHSYAFDSQRVYWFDGSGRILSCPLEGCSETGAVQLGSSSTNSRFMLSVDNAGLYWFEMMPFNNVAGICGNGGSLRFCTLDQCAAGEATVLADAVFAYALSDRDVYFTKQADDCNQGPIQRMPKPTQ